MRDKTTLCFEIEYFAINFSVKMSCLSFVIAKFGHPWKISNLTPYKTIGTPGKNLSDVHVHGSYDLHCFDRFLIVVQ